MCKRIKEWWARWGTIVQLQGLDDRLLADIGLPREGLRARLTGRGAVTDGKVCACDQPRLKPAEPALHGGRMGDKRGGL